MTRSHQPTATPTPMLILANCKVFISTTYAVKTSLSILRRIALRGKYAHDKRIQFPGDVEDNSIAIGFGWCEQTFRLVWTDHKRLTSCTHTHTRTQHARIHYIQARCYSHTACTHRFRPGRTDVYPFHPISLIIQKLWIKFLCIETFWDPVNSNWLNLATSHVPC